MINSSLTTTYRNRKKIIINSPFTWIFFLLFFKNIDHTLTDVRLLQEFSNYEKLNFLKDINFFFKNNGYMHLLKKFHFLKKITNFYYFSQPSFILPIFHFLVNTGRCLKLDYELFVLDFLDYTFFSNNLYMFQPLFFKKVDIIYSKKNYKSKTKKKAWSSLLIFNSNYLVFYDYVAIFSERVKSVSHIFKWNYLTSYNEALNNYCFLLEKFFYSNYYNFFKVKILDKLVCTWFWSLKHFVVFLASSKNNEIFNFTQNKIFIWLSSIRFIKLFKLPKFSHTQVSLKLIMVQHLRRLLITSNISNFFLLLKTNVKDFDFLIKSLYMPSQEIFVNPLNKKLYSSLVIDISLTKKNYDDFNNYFEKYKSIIFSFFNKIPNKDLDIEFWLNFCNNFKEKLIFVKNDKYFISSHEQEIFLRYFFSASFIFLIKNKKKFVKYKKLNSLSRRRYKQIISTAKRRLWIF